MAIATILREGADEIERDGTPSQVGPLPEQLRFAADELERICKQRDVCAEKYANLLDQLGAGADM